MLALRNEVFANYKGYISKNAPSGKKSEGSKKGKRRVEIRGNIEKERNGNILILEKNILRI